MHTIFTFLNSLFAYIAGWINNSRLFLINHSEDILVNLISSAIEVVVTVGIIDVILKRQETKKWKPAKGLLLSDLLNITDELIFELLPKNSRQIEPTSYKFGNTLTTTTVVFDKQNIPIIANEIKNNLNYYLSANLDMISDVHKQLEYVLKLSSIIMQPTLFNQLLKLDRALTKYKQLRLEYGDKDDYEEEPETRANQEFIPCFLEVLTLSVLLRDYLIDQSDGNIKRMGRI